MEVLRILQLCFVLVVFAITLLFVLLPLKLIPLDPTRQASRKTRRLLDLCHSFSVGVFLGTCFIMLLPHAEETMEKAFGAGGLPWSYSSVVTQLSCMLGFFVVLLIDKSIETCRSGRQTVARNELAADVHELTTVKDYIVTVSSSDGSVSDNESDVELVQERESMLRTGSTADHSKERLTRIKKKRANRTHKHNASDHSVGATGSSDNVAAVPRCHSQLVAPADHGELNIRPIVLLLALSLHSLFEGVAVGLQDTVMQLLGIAIGICVHGCLVAFALGMALVSHTNGKRSNVIRFGAVYSVMVPVGTVIGMAIGTVQGFVGRLVSALLQALTAGTFMYVIFVEVLPSENDKDRDRLLKVLIMFAGFIVISCLRFVAALM